MTWPFCPQCGSILEHPVANNVTCDVCHFTCPFVNLQMQEVITRSAPTPKPAWLVDDEENKEKTNNNKHAIIEEPCPKCAHPEMYFYTMQLRSVDEGSTVFYECPKCTHKFSVNN
jgi:DNA-directed RNA polymerase I subunit RPA12